MASQQILIVDDNPSNVKLARLLLESAGFEVKVAGDSNEALRTLESFSPQLVLMDIQLPGMDGLTLTQRLRESGALQGTVIVAVTAYAMQGDEERAKAAGCDGYISKPINTRTFVSQVRSYLKEPAAKPAQPQDSDPNDLLRELRNGFVADGAELSRRYASVDPAGAESEMMQRMVHHWVGMGATLGFPEVTTVARNLEETLRTRAMGWEQRASRLFSDLYSNFTGLMSSGGFPAVPKEFVHDLALKQIGFVGFNETEAARLRSAFDSVNATARDLGALSTGLGMEALHVHDLIVLNACSKEGAASWDSVAAQPVLEKPVLVVASRSALLDSQLGLMDRARDFVLEPWDSEELLCRAHKVICQKPGVQPQKSERRAKPVIILADDDPIIHKLLTPMFNKLGIDCYSTRDGKETLDAVGNLTPDILILDVMMPGMGGLSVLREIRKVREHSKIPILMLSARQQRSDISMALACGANDYVVKPFDPEDLVLRVRRLLPRETGGKDEGQFAFARNSK